MDTVIKQDIKTLRYGKHSFTKINTILKNLSWITPWPLQVNRQQVSEEKPRTKHVNNVNIKQNKHFFTSPGHLSYKYNCKARKLHEWCKKEHLVSVDLPISWQQLKLNMGSFRINEIKIWLLFYVNTIRFI